MVIYRKHTYQSTRVGVDITSNDGDAAVLVYPVHLVLEEVLVIRGQEA